MRGLLLTLVLLCMLMHTHVLGDLYLHNPRGSNNRLAETSDTRNNGNRLFDSQNNARGGYNVGDRSTTGGTTNNVNPDGMAGSADPSVTLLSNSASGQYPMTHFEGSEISVEWTAQHGCGGNEIDDTNQLNCAILIQYMCDTDTTVTDQAMSVLLRDGSSTTRPTAPSVTTGDGLQAIVAATTSNNAAGTLDGRHESEAYYYECQTRQRNKGLYIADQALTQDFARYTRQNNAGTQNGLECPEERDYYPYWAPTPWRDVAYMSDDVDYCNTNIAPLSQNVSPKGKCTDPTGAFIPARIKPLTQETCEASAISGLWKTFTHGAAAPACLLGDWSRANHLGSGRTGYPNVYNWTLPKVSALKAAGIKTYGGDTFARCVMRIRYNISTDDYDPYNTDALTTDQVDPLTRVTLPPNTNPTVQIGASYIDYDNQAATTVNLGLRLAINTNQFGRTFQDRSHVFYIQRRSVALRNLTAPANVTKLVTFNETRSVQDPVTGNWSDTIVSVTRNASVLATHFVLPKIFNLNVKGKRGNIVQTFPSTEYDFTPNVLHVTTNDLIHIQWTGSNTHNNNGGGGDGQAGDAGEGTAGTDRHNFVLMGELMDNYPLPLDKEPAITMWNLIDCFDWDGTPMLQIDCQIRLATSGYYQSLATLQAQHSETLSATLDNAPPSLARGVLIKFKPAAAGRQYNYMCTRNNSFSNRSQKGILQIHAAEAVS